MMKRSTLRLLELLLGFDILLLVIGILYIVLFLLREDLVLETSSFFIYIHHRAGLWKAGAALGSYGALSSLFNCLAVIGIRRSCRCLLLPYLSFIIFVILGVLAQISYICLSFGLDPRVFLLLFLLFPLGIVFVRILRQILAMKQIESPLPRLSVLVRREEPEPAPKYEDIEQDLPPQYEDVVEI